MSKLLVDEISDADNTGPVTVTDGLNVSSGNVGIGTSSPAYLLDIFGSGGTSMAVGASTGKIFLYADNAGSTVGSLSAIPMRFNVNGSERMRILPTGGITFNGDTAAANALDDYEEGVWVPNQGSGLTVSGAFSSNGSYVKVGNVVTARFQLQGATSIATGAAGTEITSNLPFATGPNYASGTFTGTSNIGFTVFNTYNSAAYSPSSITGNEQLVFSITYITP